MRNNLLPLLVLFLVVGFAVRIELAQVSLVAPADDSETVAVAPTFTWDSVDGSESYDVQVATKRNMRRPVIDVTGIQSTSFEPTPPLDENKDYFWRARAVDADGLEGPWSSVWNFKTGRLPGQTALISPEHQSDAVDLNPEMAWADVGLADYYAVDVSLSAEFTSIVYSQEGITGTGLTLPVALQPQTRYYWRVKTINAVGEGPFSPVAWFETLGASPAQVALVFPADGATDVETMPTFSWSPASGAESYRLEVAESPDFGSPLIDTSGLTSTSFEASEDLENGAILYWRVRGTNSLGDGPASAVHEFTTVAGGSAQVVLVSPPDNSQDVELTPTLTWQAVDGAETYRLQVSTQAGFSGDFLHDTVVNGPQFQIGPLPLGETYFWRVRASNTGSENWSTVSSFVTGAGAPAQIVLLAPANGAIDQELEPALAWAASNLAETYNLEIGLDSDFFVVLLSESGLTATSLTPDKLDASTDFYWRVQGVNGAGAGPWSGTRVFTTRTIQAPEAPVLIFPPDGASGVAIKPVMSWNTSEGADSYKLELSKSPPNQAGNFVTVVTAVVVAQPFFQAPELSSGEVYYWRVEARNDAGSRRSEVRTFSTATVTATESAELPTDLRLEQNYPNPFNPSTRIRYALPTPMAVRLEIIDLSGRTVTSLVSETQPAGVHEVMWNGRADDGSTLASGVYLYRISTPTETRVMRLILAK